MKTTPVNALMHQVQTRPDATAFIFHDDVWTYGRLAAEADRLARGLAARGVGPGDRVALHMVNRPEMLVAYYACFRLGAIAAPLRSAFKFAELAPLLQRLKPALYIGEIGLYGNVGPVDVTILAPNKRFVVNGSFEDHGVQPWEALFDEGDEDTLLVPPASYRPAVLINTSGTTGQPKFVTHTPATLAETANLMIEGWGLSDDDVMILAMPMAHMGGLGCFLVYVQFGIPFILLESFDADVVLDIIESYRCTLYTGFPPSMRHCLIVSKSGHGIWRLCECALPRRTPARSSCRSGSLRPSTPRSTTCGAQRRPLDLLLAACNPDRSRAS